MDVGGEARNAPRAESSGAESDALRLLDVVRRLNTIADAQTLLDALAEAVAATAGYRIAVISLTLPQGGLVGAHNLAAEDVAKFRADALATPLARRVVKRERIRARAFPGTGIAFVPHDADLPFGSAFRPTDHLGAGSWHPNDRLFLLARGPAGRDIGVVSLDDPFDGEAPRPDALDALRLAEQLLEIGGNFLHARLFEAELRESEERYRRLVDTSPDGILVSSDGRIVFANRALAVMLGADGGQDLVGTAPLDLVHPDDRADAERCFAAIRGGGRTPVRHRRLLRRDGAVVDVESVGIPIEYGGKPAEQVILRDIGERLRLEDQIRQSQKMEAVGRLAGGVAHEFNNLLTVITGFGQMLQSRCAGDSGAEGYLDRILAASERAATLTRQLLAFARKEVVRPALVDPNEVVRETQSMVARLAGPGVEFITHLAPSPGRVRADPHLLGQVLMNLVVNACDAMPRGGRITIETRDVRDPAAPELSDLHVPAGPCVVISVSDTGVGMDEATRAHVFEPFFTTKGVGKGTGLGLATAYGIITQSGGDVVCRSRPGAGTAFLIYLPVVVGDTEDAPRAPAQRAAVQRRRTILVVDDEDAIRGLMRDVLAFDGHEVLVAAGGHEALSVSASHTGEIDLLITDVGMPRMDGRELAARFVAARPSVRVLFVSGYLGAAEGGSLVLAERAAYLPKPFGAAELRAKVGELLASSSLSG